MLVLIHPDSRPQTKGFMCNGNQLEEIGFTFSKVYNWAWLEIGDLKSLSDTLLELETKKDQMVVRGRPVSGTKEGQHINRRMNGHGANLCASPCQWLCIDIDDLALHEEMSDFNESPYDVARFAAQGLPQEFHEVDFHFQFSSSMGIKPGIRIHLWYWLDRPISDDEAKAWLRDADVKIDLSLYSPIQPHFTAAPVFQPPEADPVQLRSALHDYGYGVTAVPVPDDLDQIAKTLTREKQSHWRIIDAQGHLDGDRVVRNAQGLVVDGREQFLFHKSVEAARKLSKGLKKPQQFDDLDALTELTWAWFCEEADLSDGKWSIEKARERAHGRIADIRAGKLLLGRDNKISLLPVQEPYFDFSSVDADTGAQQMDAALSDFFEGALSGDGTQRKLALRITMGSGKTTATIEHLKRAFQSKPDLNVEIYVPRHELIDEVAGLLDGIDERIEVVHVRGRDHDHENGNAPCSRYEYVKLLGRAGLSVRTNACRRSETERCDHIDECAYWRQFSKSINSTGSVRIFPHAFLPLKRDERLPDPDITIIDESFFMAGHSCRCISDARLRSLFNDHLGRETGDFFVNMLRDGFPLLKSIREQGFDSAWFDPERLDGAEQTVSFERSKNTAPARPLHDNHDVRTAKQILRVISEELQNTAREDVARLRYSSKKNRIIVDTFALPHLNDSAHLLILDATADEMILERLFGSIDFKRIDIDQRAITTQVYDRTGSNISWGKQDNIDDLILMLKEHSSIGEKTLCISHKDLADYLRDLGFADNLRFTHFGNIRGIDAYRDFDTVFITGRNQAPQVSVDGIARALFWNAEKPLKHDDGAKLDAGPEVDLLTETRGYLLTDPDLQLGVEVRSFTDGRIEAIHQQMREAETVQAIARLRLVHAPRLKYVYLLGNLPLEMPIDNLVEWNDLAPNTAEKELIAKGNIPLSPLGWMKMRPDIANDLNRAKYINKTHGLGAPQDLLKVSPLMARLGCWKVSFKPTEGRKQVHSHLFRTTPTVDMGNEDNPGIVAVAEVPIGEWKRYLEEGDPEIDGSGWASITDMEYEWLKSSSFIAYPNADKDQDTEAAD